MPSPRRASLAAHGFAALLLAACGSAPQASEADASLVSSEVRRIAAVQGRGARSPLEGADVTVEGVVTGNFARGLGGFFIQSAAGTDDGDPATAEGLFVLATPSLGEAPRGGELVRVSGVVREVGSDLATLTALEPRSAVRLGRGRTSITELAHAPATAQDWERYEGMRLRIEAPLTISGNENLLRYGELTVAFDGRLFQPTELAPPGPEAERIAADNARRALVLDDNRGGDYPERLWILEPALSARAPWRAGSVLAGAVGILDQRHGGYRLQLTQALRVAEPAARPAAPARAGDLRVVSFNLLNLFNGDGRGGGFPTARGAADPDGYRRQRAKLVATVAVLDPDVLAVLELENDGDGPDSSLAELLAALDRASRGARWRAVRPPDGRGPGVDQIRVGLLYRADRVREAGRAAQLTGGPFAAGSRVPLAQAFRLATGGPAVVVAANHFKSKGGCDDAHGADVDQGDGQGCWNATRVTSARRLAAWLAADPTGVGGELAMIVGDLNAYGQEDPIQALHQRGWRDAFPKDAAAPPYSFTWAGRVGRLDHALVSANLASSVANVVEWHTNADESETFDYRHAGLAAALDPYRASDHDPLVIDLTLGPR